MIFKPRSSFYSKAFLSKTPTGCDGNPVLSLKKLAFRSEFSLVAVSRGSLRSAPVVSCQKAVKYHLSRSGFLRLVCSLSSPVTRKGLGSRIGKGKGAVVDFQGSVTAGALLFSLGGVPKNSGRFPLVQGSYKLGVPSKVFYRLVVAQ